MTEQEILEGSELIAEYVGIKFNDKENAYEFSAWLPQFAGSDHGEWCSSITKDYHTHYLLHSDSMKYHKSWDWLMPVIEKIINTCYCDVSNECYQFLINSSYTWIKKDGLTISFSGNSHEDRQRPLVFKAFKTVVGFIKWYNKNMT